MATFVLTYRALRGYQGSADAMAAWNTWFKGLGDNLVDRGNPVFARTAIGNHGADTVLGGYSLVTADDLEAAVSLAKGMPRASARRRCRSGRADGTEPRDTLDRGGLLSEAASRSGWRLLPLRDHDHDASEPCAVCSRCCGLIEQRMLVAGAASDKCVACTRAIFNEKFSDALNVFQENLLIWKLGMTSAQRDVLRLLCARHNVAFDPLHYAQLARGSFAGWVGGPDYAKTRALDGTLYVAVNPEGEAFGLGGSPVAIDG